MKTKIWLSVILLITQVGSQDKPKGTITEAEALNYISKTYESAYIQGAQDVMSKWIEWRKNGEKNKIEFEYFMKLKDKRLKEFLTGK